MREAMDSREGWDLVEEMGYYGVDGDYAGCDECLDDQPDMSEMENMHHDDCDCQYDDYDYDHCAW